MWIIKKRQKTTLSKKNEEDRVKWSKWIIAAIIIPLLCVLIPLIYNELKTESPIFTLDKASYHPDSTIIIYAENSSARKNKPIHLEIDGFRFVKIAEPIKENNTISWQINLNRLELPENVHEDGIHSVRFGTSLEKMSKGQKISFDSKAPQVKVGYISDSPTDKIIVGRVLEDQNIKVKIAFRHQEKLQAIIIPVQEYVEYNRKMFQFEYRIQNLPQISADDPKYSELFFILNIKDEAGNEFIQKLTYNAFMRENIQTFSNSSFKVLMLKQEQEIPKIKNTIPSRPKPLGRKIASDPPLITLRMLIRTSKNIKFTWSPLPNNLGESPEEYVMIRDNKAIGSSFDTSYIDRTMHPDSTYSYQVLARGKSDVYYRSNTITTTPLQEKEDSKKEKAQLTIISIPEGAEILLGGNWLGKTPYISTVNSGIYKLQLFMSDYNAIDTTIVISANAQIEFSFQLIKLFDDEFIK